MKWTKDRFVRELAGFLPNFLVSALKYTSPQSRLANPLTSIPAIGPEIDR
jgi:hypothetical protein